MIYVAIIDTDPIPGMVSSGFAAKHFYRAFDSLAAAQSHLANKLIPDDLFDDYNENSDDFSFKDLAQICLKYKQMIFTWDIREMSLEDAGYLCEHITVADWRHLFNEDHFFYLLCIKQLNSVAFESLGDNFIKEHNYLISISDIRGALSEGYLSLYDMVRIKRPGLFLEIEEHLLKPPPPNLNIDVVVDEYKQWQYLAKSKNETLLEPNEIVRKSRYYGKAQLSLLLEMIEDAAKIINS